MSSHLELDNQLNESEVGLWWVGIEGRKIPSGKSDRVCPRAVIETGEGHLGGSVNLAAAFGSAHDPRVLGSSLASGSLLSSLSLCSSPLLLLSVPVSVSVSLFQINQVKKTKNRRNLLSWGFLILIAYCIYI